MTSATQVTSEAVPQYAQVAVPVHLNKLFTYRLPPAVQRAARIGSRVIVQLGKKAQTGYIVALLPRLRSGTSLVESEIKNVQELLDVEESLMPPSSKMFRRCGSVSSAIACRRRASTSGAFGMASIAPSCIQYAG